MLEMSNAVNWTEDQPGAEYDQTKVQEHQRQQQRHHLLDPVIARCRNERTQDGQGQGEYGDTGAKARHAIADYDSDALGKPFAEASLAIVEAQLGDIDSAVAALPHLLEVPNGETRGDLQINPLWDPLRKDPRFQKLVAAEQH
jgi:hypothetical protein